MSGVMCSPVGRGGYKRFARMVRWTHRLPLPANPVPAGPVSIRWRKPLKETSIGDGIGNHAHVIGQRDEGSFVEAETDDLSAALIPQLKHDDALPAENAGTEIDVTEGPDLDRVLFAQLSASAVFRSGSVAEGEGAGNALPGGRQA